MKATALLLFAMWVGARDWRWGVPIVGMLSGWLPWMQYDDRPIVEYRAPIDLYQVSPSELPIEESALLPADPVADLARGMQVSEVNPLVGIDGRVDLLRRLGTLVASKPRSTNRSSAAPTLSALPVRSGSDASAGEVERDPNPATAARNAASTLSAQTAT